MSDVRAKKHLGQHFLKEPEIAQRIAHGLTGHGGYTHVIEVGPGTGALTQHLIADGRFDLTCFEVDTESIAHLASAYPDLRVRQSDFLQMDPDRTTSGPMAVIGNFPYNISTQIVFKILDHRDRIPEMVGMFQKEVADRIACGPGSKTYGITSVLVQAWYTVETLFNVEPSAFIPPPKVRSSVIRMQRNNVRELPCDEALFRRVVKTAFNQRRKTLNNALKGMIEFKNGVPAAYAGKRAEQLSVADFIALTQACGQ
ncbi:MAG TPA: 16S rRNA (adenine(1518)-N(6)/adenine(1519)-N(6))-dimethyltransferase RsmA [Flavobacteriales bacterium]|nr:16S rRNA (adenine(1518)-N(6)/adenine(1519)-N(6))-dimethyltransferase RsmA [Flavobacteriales bacterium]